jgi:hypothetical protein
MFLENTIKTNTKRPVFTDHQDIPAAFQPSQEQWTPDLIQWNETKSLIFDILDHRLANAEEIDSGTNNTYMSMDEHLLVFMLERH